jgi:hypothetical protein
MASQIFNITQASTVVGASGTQLVLLITPQPTIVNGTSGSSPYVMPYSITSPNAAETSGYVYGATITLTSDK